jgi:hypothetical protein
MSVDTVKPASKWDSSDCDAFKSECKIVIYAAGCTNISYIVNWLISVFLLLQFSAFWEISSSSYLVFTPPFNLK